MAALRNPSETDLKSDGAQFVKGSEDLSWNSSYFRNDKNSPQLEFIQTNPKKSELCTWQRSVELNLVKIILNRDIWSNLISYLWTLATLYESIVGGRKDLIWLSSPQVNEEEVAYSSTTPPTLVGR